MDALQKLAQGYAAKFAAETVSAEPPKWVEPTHHHLEVALAGCVRPPKVGELHAIREAFMVAYSAGEYGSQLPGRRITYVTAPSAWDEDAEYPSEDWRSEVANGDTRRGYLDWVAECREIDEEAAAEEPIDYQLVDA